MANNKSIQILRGGPNYDPSISTEILLDGQPFYSKKNGKFYIGDGESELKQLPGIDIDLNIENGGSEYSIQQKGISDDKSPKATGLGAIAFGGYRGDKPNGTPDAEDRTTIAEGIQSAAFGAGNYAHGPWNFVAGKDNNTYQQNSTSFGGGNQAGMKKDEFEAYYWDSTNNTSLHDGKGKDASGNVLDQHGRTHEKSYSFSFATGEQNKIHARSTIGFGAVNTAKGQYNLVGGNDNNIEAESGIVVGSKIKTEGRLYNIAVFGSNQKLYGSNNFTTGDYNSVWGWGSSALGSSLTTSKIQNFQTVVGVLNNVNDDALFVVGNGQIEYSLSNDWKSVTLTAKEAASTIDYRGYDIRPGYAYILLIKDLKINGESVLDFDRPDNIKNLISSPYLMDSIKPTIVRANSEKALLIPETYFNGAGTGITNKYWSFNIPVEAGDTVEMEYYLYHKESQSGEICLDRSWAKGGQNIYSYSTIDSTSKRNNALEILNNGTAQADKFQSKESVWDGESVIFEDGTKGTQSGDVVPGAEAIGFGSAAFGVVRYDYYTSPETHAANLDIDLSSTENWGRKPTSAEGNQSFAAGGSSHAYGDWAVAMGKDVKAYQGGSVSLGGGTKAGMTFDEWKTIYGNGDPNFTKDTKITITMADGTYNFSYKDYYSFAIALGDSAKAYQRSSVAIGKDAKAYAWNAIAIGKNAVAGVSGFANEGDSAIALGLNAKATKSGAMALGEGTASGVNSLVLQSGNAIGTGSVAIKGTANGSGSITIGPATANSGNSFAIGHQGTTADKWNSFAIGRNAKSTADTSFSYGFNVTSSATGALAVNEGTQALGKDCFAAGCYTKTHSLTADKDKDKYGQAVFGHYNIGSENNAFEIGNGTANARSNVFAVDWNGNVVTSNGTLATQGWVRENGGFTPVSYRPVETTYGSGFTFNLGEEEIVNNGIYLIEISAIGVDQDCIGVSLTFTGENAITWVASPCIHYYMSSDGKKEIYPNTYIQAYCMGPHQIYVDVATLDNSKTVAINPTNVKLTRIA